MLIDLNVLIDNMVNFKTMFLYCQSSFDETRHRKPDCVQHFLTASLWRHAVIELHKLVGVEANNYYSLWNFWDRMEAGHYLEEAIPRELLHSWRELLYLWNREIEVVKRLYAKHTGCPAGSFEPELHAFSLREMGGMLKVIEFVVLAMFNPVVQGNFTYIGTIFDKPVPAGASASASLAGDAPVILMTYPAA
ncbi:hypothetical protein EGT74_05320 [Chitinophaga lutea]|uniref:Uncharacterized protein n=2 Tax=Chitinophaga lutea TaxID=2488634 RepID=A0A3N4PW02_9BACT|nr:hypothetical protein EGT74_05320 [Chitinophaga lutea]